MAEGRHFEIQIDGRTYPVAAAKLTGLEIKELGGIAPTDQLFERQEPGGDLPVSNEDVVEIRSGEKFYHLPGSITAGA